MGAYLTFCQTGVKSDRSLLGLVAPKPWRRRTSVRSGIAFQVLCEETIDALPRIAQHLRAREVVELARVDHEVNQAALPFRERGVDQADRMQIRHVDVG